MRFNQRFPCVASKKRLNFVSLRGRTAAVAILKFEAWHPVAKRGSTRQEESPITKNMRYAASFRPAIVRYGMTNRIVKDCRVGRTRPPRNDRIGKYGTQNPIFRFRKTLLIRCLLLTGSDFFDSLKRGCRTRGILVLRYRTHGCAPDAAKPDLRRQLQTEGIMRSGACAVIRRILPPRADAGAFCGGSADRSP